MAQTNDSPAAGTSTITNTTTTTTIGFEGKKPEIPKYVGHLLKEPVEIDCPACRQHNVTRVEAFPVTAWQIIVHIFNRCCCCCKDPIKWEGRYDYNHYCAQCGCYIGRYMSLSCGDRAMLRKQRRRVEIQQYSDDNKNTIIKKAENLKKELHESSEKKEDKTTA